MIFSVLFMFWEDFFTFLFFLYTFIRLSKFRFLLNKAYFKFIQQFLKFFKDIFSISHISEKVIENLLALVLISTTQINDLRDSNF